MRQLKSHYDIGVIGLGPVGAFAANVLGRVGLKVLAVDQLKTPFMKPRAIAIDDMSLRLLQCLGVPEMIASSLEDYRESEYRAASGEVIRRIRQPQKPYFQAWTPYVTFVQPALELALRVQLQGCEEIDLALGARAELMTSSEDSVSIRLTDTSEGKAQDVTCKYLLACDGASSSVREKLGISLEDLNFNEPWLVVDILVNETAHLPEVNIQNCDPARPSTYVRGPGMLRRWEIMLLPGESPEEIANESNIWKLLSSQITPDQGKLWRAATYRFHALVANEWRRDNIFLLGDAAHQTPPFMGQGLNQGLRDAGNICWKLKQVLRRRASKALLDSYQVERRPMTKAVIETAKQLGLIICELDRDEAAKRNARMLDEMRDGRGDLVRQDLIPSKLEAGFMMHEPDRTLAAGTGSIFPQSVLCKDGQQLRFDDEVLGAFVLVARPGWSPDPVILRKAKNLEITIVTLGESKPGVLSITEKDGVLTRWLENLGADSVLVRPDHFVFGTARGNGAEESLVTALEAALEFSKPIVAI